MKLFNRVRVFDDWEEDDLIDAYDRVYTEGSKVGVFYHRDNYNSILRSKLKRTEPPEKLLDRYMLENRALLLSPSCFFFEVFNRKLQQYIEADLINYNTRSFQEANNHISFKKKKEPFAILTLGELEAGFVVCLIPLVISIFVFASEWASTLKDLLVSIFLFKNYYRIKKFQQENYFEIIEKQKSGR